MSLAGVTLVANSIDLKYPFVPCISNLSLCCDKVYVSTDINNKDGTLDVLKSLKTIYNIEIVESEWDWSVTSGSDLAYRANLCVERAINRGFKNLLYVQADEVICFDEINLLKGYKNFWGAKNISLERTYFWKDLNHINKDWTIYLDRLVVLTEKVSVGGDGMYINIDNSFPLVKVPPSTSRIYHYSRVGDTKYIAKRLNKLDSLFHNQDEYLPLNDYSFGINNNFEQGADSKNIIPYNGPHPKGIPTFYGLDV